MIPLFSPLLLLLLLARTSFPVLLQPVKPGYPGGGGSKCVRFTLVAAPRVKNVTYIKVRRYNTACKVSTSLPACLRFFSLFALFSVAFVRAWFLWIESLGVVVQ